jgi:hypothetical protein
MMDEQDFLARLTAEEDQAQSALVAMATRVTLYRKYLILGGITDGLLDDLVRDYHCALLDASVLAREDEHDG